MKKLRSIFTVTMILLFYCITGYSQNQETKFSTGKDENLQEISESLDLKKLIYIKVVYFSLKEGRGKEFARWIRENQDGFAKSLPAGWKFLGCYKTIFHIGRHGWHFRYEIEGMGAYDRLALYDNEEFDQYLSKIYSFIDLQLPMETEIYRKIKGNENIIDKE
jgi:hypothetical protein